jgi:enamine deaminase RidA (YjgF/YER057c/UK114 family)
VTSLHHLDEMREVRRRYLGSEPPASTAVQVVALVVPEAMIEVDLVAALPA